MVWGAVNLNFSGCGISATALPSARQAAESNVGTCVPERVASAIINRAARRSILSRVFFTGMRRDERLSRELRELS